MSRLITNHTATQEHNMNGREEYRALTGFKPSRVARYVLLFDYGYGPNQWVCGESAKTEDAIRAKRRRYPQWHADKVRILDLER